MKIEEILKSLNVEIKLAGEHHHARDGWGNADCPFCSPGSGRFRMGINLVYNYVNCWSCGKLNLIEVLHELTKQSYSDLKKLLQDVETQEAPEKQLHTGKLKIPPGADRLLCCHEDYLESRGFTPRALERLWGIRGYGPIGDLKWRILIPISYRGQVVSWTSRTICDNVKKRYWSARPDEETIRHKDLLFGEDYCRHSIIINEGPFDSMKIGPGATCTFGLSYSQQQLLKMSKYLKRIVCFDNTPDAQKVARELCDQLDVFDGQTYNVCLDAKDPGEASPKEIKKLRKMLDG